MSEIPEDKKELIDTLTSGYAFCDQDAEEMAELIEIGRLAVEDRTKALATGKAPEHRKQSTYLDYTKAHVALAQSCDAYLAKQEESK